MNQTLLIGSESEARDTLNRTLSKRKHSVTLFESGDDINSIIRGVLFNHLIKQPKHFSNTRQLR